jgi:NADH-quinone oxidoreductase subunit L
MYYFIVFLPLLGALVAGLAGTSLPGALRASLSSPGGDTGHHHDAGHAHAAHDDHGHDHHHGPVWPNYLTTFLMLITAALSWYGFVEVMHGAETVKVPVLSWIHSGTLSADWSFRIDTLTATMLVVVNTVSALVHLYSVGYMSHDEHQPRFFAYLSLFTFAMLMLVTSDNLVQMFFGWEGVGLASYLLIGFWYKKQSASAAAIKAFVVNRVGDFGFALGIFACFAVFGTVEFDALFAAAPSAVGQTIHFLGGDFDTLTVICLLLFMGAMGKSAQFLLHTWLPDAMEGPTPVSALIHAATMVTAGVFLVARLSPLYELAPHAQTFIVVIGAITAFFAATVGLVQNDIKRIIAYSTCSQLGYMFVAMGLGAYGIGMFHLFTHAFFKALLFLGSGSVIHAMSGEQDIRKMGALRPYMNVTWIMMLIGTLALTGFPFTAGYFSKDAILEAAFMGEGNPAHLFAFGLLLMGAFFTSFYSWRLMFLTFHGKSRADKHALEHAHESPQVMLVPLYVLAVGALVAGIVFAPFFIGHHEGEFWGASLFRAAGNDIVHAIHDAPKLVVWAPTIAMALGFCLSWLLYIKWPEIPGRIASQHDVLYRFLLNKWYIDELYDFLFVRPAMRAGRFLWKTGDGRVIDGLGPDGISARVVDVTNRVTALQSGFLYHYAFAMLIGVAAIITWFMFGGAH